LGLSARTASPGEIDLTWSGDGGYPRAFAIWRKAAGGDWQRVGAVVPGSTQFADRGLAPGTVYTYRVRATNDYFASAWSNEAAATTRPPGRMRRWRR
jgi:hypothetical protein